MKLLLCTKCSDVIKLQEEVRICLCGKVEGKYLEDGLYAVYSGESAVPIGFSNPALVSAIDSQPLEGAGALFTAFVIPKVCSTFRKVEKIP